MKELDILHAADLEYRGWKPLKAGLSVASNLPPSDDAARTTLASLRLLPSFWDIDIYGEYTAKFNEDIKQNIFNGSESIVGQGFLRKPEFLSRFSFTYLVNINITTTLLSLRRMEQSFIILRHL
ncbi:MAG: hypothetical protein MZV64_26300 [Ignavibacteriales bacterium]|nr:hypothetical protein [Ignavibacteriales bacterium]